MNPRPGSLFLRAIPGALATGVAAVQSITFKKTALLVGLGAVLIGLGALSATFFTASGRDEAEGNHVLTRYTFDPVQRDWVASVQSTPTTPNPDGSRPRGSNTVEIFLHEDEPIKAIVVAEALVSKGTDPLVEIAGRSGGKIYICNLVLKKVDARRLEVKSAEVVKTNIYNTVAQDNELDVEMDAVNVVRCGRGATSVLSLGLDRKYVRLDDDGHPDFDILGKERDSGIKIDRLRILGPEGKSGFVENLVVLRSSVFGAIDVRDVKLQNFVLDSVTLDDYSAQ